MKKYFTVFLAFIMYFNVFSQAHAGAEKWVLQNNVYDSVAKVIDVTAKRAVPVSANNPLYNVRVPVTASATGSTVASMIRMGIAGAAIYALIEGVGWIIDNGVVKKPKNTDQELERGYTAGSFTGGTAEYVVDKYCKSINTNYTWRWQGGWTFLGSSTRQVRGFSCYNGNQQIVVDTVYKNTQSDPIEYVPVTDTELGDKVNSSPQAPQVLPDIYNPNNPAGGAAPEATSKALDNAPPTPETESTGGTKPKPNTDTDGDGAPDTYDPAKPSLGDEFTLPEFCSWAVTVCEWYVKYKEDSIQAQAQRESEKVAWQREEEARQKEESQREKERTFWEKVTDFFDWTKEEPEKEDTELNINDQSQNEPDSTINFSTACPQKIPLTFNWNGSTLDFSFDFTIWCQAISTFVYPIVVALGSLHALYIVSGVRQDG